MPSTELAAEQFADGQISHLYDMQSTAALLQRRPVEHLFPLLDNHALAGKQLLGQHGVDVRHLLIVHRHAALLDQPGQQDG